MLIDSAQIVFHRTPLENSGISPGLLREKSLLKEKFKEKEKRKFKEKGRPRPLATVKRHGRLDILMNNAGVYGSGASQDIETMTMEEWRFVNGVNMDGVFLGCRAAIPAMAKSGGGSIINISSVAGIRPSHMAAYGASKGAVRQLTKSVAQYCGRKGYRIRCNSIHPGMVRTPLGEDVLKLNWGDVEKGAAERVKGVPLGELGTVEDIAYATLFLASDESRHINATEVVIDGGLIGAG